MNVPPKNKKKSAPNTGQPDTPDDAPLTFEESMQRLEAVVEQLQRDDLPLEQAISQYEAGVRYVQQCHQTLRQAEQRIELLMSVGPDGAAQSVPFEDHGAGQDLQEKAAQRSQRRSRRSSDEPDPLS